VTTLIKLIIDGIRLFMVATLQTWLILGDWDRFPDIRAEKNPEVLLEWKWNQGAHVFLKTDTRT
jgi:hypothetical protein